jgi:O-Antigen ligase
MKTRRIGSPRQAETSLWPLARSVGSVIAYAGVPLSTLSPAAGILTSLNVLTSYYLVGIFGVISVLRGARIESSLVRLSYFLLGWYCILLAIELTHGGPFHYFPPRGPNYLADYFPLLVLPFFAIGLREIKIEARILDRVVMLTILFSASLSLYQFFALGIERPHGFFANPIPFALVVLVWSMALFSRALQTQKIDWTRLSVALIGGIPIVLSGSKIVWACAALGYLGQFFIWAWTGQRWSTIGAVAVAVMPVAWLLSRVEVVRSRVVEFTADFGAYLVSGDTSGATFGLRFGAMTSGFLAFLERPLLGYGLAEGKTAALEHRPLDISSFAMLPNVHNDYVIHLVAFGVLGLVFLTSLFVVFIVAAARGEDVAVRHTGVVVGLIFLVYMMAESVFTRPELYGLVFFVLGLIVISPQRQRNEAASLSRGIAPQNTGRLPLPALSIRVLVTALSLGSIGFVWSQWAVLFRVTQAALLSEQPDDTVHPGSIVNKIDGSLVWRFVATGPNGPELVASFDIPATGARLRLSMHKNTDVALPASYIVEIVTSTPRDFPNKAVTEVGKLVVKLAPEAEGAELIGDVARISEGVFWMGLSADPTDADVNLRLLALGNFFDLPLTYKSGEHATLTFEKGRTGAAVFEQVITAFRQ